jgi:hypothetical protein
MCKGLTLETKYFDCKLAIIISEFNLAGQSGARQNNFESLHFPYFT